MDALHELRNSKQSFMRVKRQRDSSPQRKSRTVLSCIPCRQRKVKCDRLEPCSQCIRRGVAEACDYSSKTARAEIDISPIANSTQRGAEMHVSPPVAPVDETPVILPDVRQVPNPTCNHGLSASTRMGAVDSLTQSCFHGAGTRTRYFGRSHWALTMDMFPDLKAHLQKYHHVKQGPARHKSDYLGMKRTTQKRLEATYQTQPQSNLQPPRLECLVPDRQVTDKLVGSYFSTFETTFRILHVSQFLTEYEQFWNSGTDTTTNLWSRDVFAAKLLSLMACAADAEIKADEHTQASNQIAKGWVQAVGSWVQTVTTYAKLDLDFIQVMCLLLIARQAIAYEGDLAWLAAGSLLREAMMIGLHRDPINFKGVSPFYAEIRRRLWATIVELDLQAALDTGVPAGISEDDYDCAPPSNLDDEEFSFSSTAIPAPKPGSALTRTSFQVSLAQTLGTRIRIVKIVNQVRLSSDYQEILDLSQVITTHLSQTPLVITGQYPSEGAPSKFQQSLYLFLVYRYLLALHRPFVLSLAETRNEMYRYSREICVKACLSLLSPLTLAPDLEARPVYPHILRLRGGMFRSEIFHAAATLCFELRLQAKDSTLPLLPGALADHTDQDSDKRNFLLRTVESAIQFFEFKVRTEKQACKAFMLLNMVYTSAQSKLQSGTHGSHVNCGVMSNLTLENACPRAARRCQELLLEGEGRADCQHSEENWLGYPGNPFMNEEVPGVESESQSIQINPSPSGQSMDIASTMPAGSSDPDLFDLSFDWSMYLDPTYLNEAGNLWPLMDPLI